MEIANDNVLWRRANELFGRPREQWTTVDEMIYELPDYFNNDVEKIEKMRFKAIKEWGQFAFLDPIANSYPGYIISGDRVKLLEKCPFCGKSGPVLELDITRMAGAEAKGCANLMRGLMAEEFKKAEKK